MKLISLLFIFIPSFVFSQDIPLKEGFVVFEQIDSSVAGTKSELFQRTQQWVTTILKNSLKEIKSEKSEEGEIIVTAAGSIPTELLTVPIENIEFNITIQVKDGWYKSQISEIVGWPYMKEAAKISADLLNYRYTKSGGKNKKDKNYTAEQREADRVTLQNIASYMNSVQESIKESLNKKGA